MTRGNQRDKDREKNQKKLAAQQKGRKDAVPHHKRAETDAEIMRKKQAAALAAKEGGSAGGGK
ncbi:hypothetical protein DFQ27_001997 [Actinomortierella ambigua]|uniref:Small EDRK-rich factor-like N-terminal domain-containing protein n=1 Tax=Actinomortierella ambigua TaxID=1343610 RepID=A0A9P6QC25_9FUNG|nr:hypothetical protein DFQ26_003664 [Actinomortierella ambigua]KAG0263002.1 hypothetical protein DFQ27_001997 [Actinomortierella ambigua]